MPPLSQANYPVLPFVFRYYLSPMADRIGIASSDCCFLHPTAGEQKGLYRRHGDILRGSLWFLRPDLFMAAEHRWRNNLEQRVEWSCLQWSRHRYINRFRDFGLL